MVVINSVRLRIMLTSTALFMTDDIQARMIIYSPGFTECIGWLSSDIVLKKSNEVH